MFQANGDNIGYIVHSFIGVNELNSSEADPKHKTPSSATAPLVGLQCELGLDSVQCAAYERCVPRNNRARSGTCRCDEDYERDALLDRVYLPLSDTRRMLRSQNYIYCTVSAIIKIYYIRQPVYWLIVMNSRTKFKVMLS